jgi:hypothetical protein
VLVDKKSPAPALAQAGVALENTGSLSWEKNAHLGDWIGFAIWIGGFALIVLLHVLDLISGLFSH